MTLVAGFRCSNNGILLCADREENDGISRREVDKIYEVKRQQGTIFIAGAGPSALLIKLNAAVERAFTDTLDLATRHVHILENSLKAVLKQYSRYIERHGTIEFVVVVAFNTPPKSTPLLYRTDQEVVVPEPLRASQGCGKTICDYLADRLYTDGLAKPSLGALAAFILREAEESTSGVGLGANMIFIHEEARVTQYIEKDAVREIQAGLPSLRDALWPYWKEHVKVPKWLEE